MGSPRVFLSYCSEDRALVARLAQDLTSHQIVCWIDRRDLAPGDRWEDRIRDAIEDANFFLPCFSNAYELRRDTFMIREIEIAVAHSAHRSPDNSWIIPVLFSKVPRSEVPSALQSLQWVDLSESWRPAMKRLAGAIHPRRQLVKKLAKTLRSGDLAKRLVAARLLRALRDEASTAVKALAAAIDDPRQTHQVRSIAIDSLFRLGMPGIRRLIEREQVPAMAGDADVRRLAIAALSISRARPALESHARGMIYELEGAGALPAWRRILRDPRSQFRDAAASCIGRSFAQNAGTSRQRARASKHLAQAIADPSIDVQRAAIRAAAEGGIGSEEIIVACENACLRVETRWEAIEALGRLRSQRSFALLREFAPQHPLEVMKALARCGASIAPSVPWIVDMLVDGSEGAVWRAVCALEEVLTKDDSLRDMDRARQRDRIMDYNWIPTTKVADGVRVEHIGETGLHMLMRSSDVDVRRATIEAIGRHRILNMKAWIEHAVSDREVDVRELAQQVLPKLGASPHR